MYNLFIKSNYIPVPKIYPMCFVYVCIYIYISLTVKFSFWFRLKYLWLFSFVAFSIIWKGNSLVNIYANDTILYECRSKNLDDQRLQADFSSDSALTAQWGKNWFLIFNTSKTKPVTFHCHWADFEFSPIRMNGLLALNVYLGTAVHPRPHVELIYMLHC